MARRGSRADTVARVNVFGVFRVFGVVGVLGVVAPGAVAGCWSVAPESGLLLCNTGPGAACPASYYCASDGKCWRTGESPSDLAGDLSGRGPEDLAPRAPELGAKSDGNFGDGGELDGFVPSAFDQLFSDALVADGGLDLPVMLGDGGVIPGGGDGSITGVELGVALDGGAATGDLGGASALDLLGAELSASPPDGETGADLAGVTEDLSAVVSAELGVAVDLSTGERAADLASPDLTVIPCVVNGMACNGRMCGTAMNNCGGMDTCGSCDVGLTCGGSGTPGVCGACVDGTACDDGNACTFNDLCHANQCQGTSYQCAPTQCQSSSVCDGTGACNATNAADGTGCDDGNPCTSGDACTAGACGGSAYSCAPGTCQSASTCNGAGGCSITNAADGTGCDDGNACTHGDACSGGACGGIAYTCAPNSCQTSSTCDGAGGCSVANVADGTGCDDGNACTVGDNCVTGACSPGAATACNSPPTCYGNGVCNTTTGACGYTASAAGTACPDDGNECTSDACDGSGMCGHTPVGDGTGCTYGSCCSGYCADLASDDANCGYCGNQCGGPTTCSCGEYQCTYFSQC